MGSEGVRDSEGKEDPVGRPHDEHCSSQLHRRLRAGNLPLPWHQPSAHDVKGL